MRVITLTYRNPRSKFFSPHFGRSDSKSKVSMAINITQQSKQETCLYSIQKIDPIAYTFFIVSVTLKFLCSVNQIINYNLLSPSGQACVSIVLCTFLKRKSCSSSAEQLQCLIWVVNVTWRHVKLLLSVKNDQLAVYYL